MTIGDVIIKMDQPLSIQLCLHHNGSKLLLQAKPRSVDRSLLHPAISHKQDSKSI